jgi:anti-sigma factor RsiW
VEQKFHGTDDQLEQYVLGRLSSQDVEILEEHLMVCVACQEKLDGVANFALGMREVLETDPVPVAVVPQEAARKTSWFDWVRRPAFSMALGFAALILVIAIFSNGKTKFAPSASLQLTAMRGEMPSTVPALQFELALSDAPREGGPFRVEVVNDMGLSMWSGLAPSSPDGVHVNVLQKLEPGGYFVRIYSAEGKVLREYGFRVHA